MGPAGHIAEKDVHRCEAGGRALSHLLGESLNIYLLPYACLIEIGSAASRYAAALMALTHASVALRETWNECVPLLTTAHVSLHGDTVSITTIARIPY